MIHGCDDRIDRCSNMTFKMYDSSIINNLDNNEKHQIYLYDQSSCTNCSDGDTDKIKKITKNTILLNENRRKLTQNDDNIDCSGFRECEGQIYHTNASKVECTDFQSCSEAEFYLLWKSSILILLNLIS